MSQEGYWEFQMVDTVPIEGVGVVTVSTNLLEPDYLVWETCLFWPDPAHYFGGSVVVERVGPPWFVCRMQELHNEWVSKPARIAKEIHETKREEEHGQR